jgi:hypothetical protein
MVDVMMTWSPVWGIEMPDRMEEALRRLDPAAPGRRFQAAEAQLYPLIMVDSALYEMAVTLVGEALGVLREQCHATSDLTDVDVARVLARCPSAEAAAASGFEPGVAVDAACAQRWRELTATQSRDAGSGPAVRWR